MSFFEKVKQATGQAAERLRDEVEELKAKRELAQAYSDLGKQTAELVESGQLSHPGLQEAVEKIRTMKAELAAAEAAGTGVDQTPPES
jgi:hypothetical protein